QGVALHELLVARQHMLAIAAAGGVVEARLLHALLGDVDHLLGVDVPQRALLDRAGHGLLERIARQPDETLPVGVALSFRIEPAIDDVHGQRPYGRPHPALFTRMYHSTKRRVWRAV